MVCEETSSPTRSWMALHWPYRTTRSCLGKHIPVANALPHPLAGVGFRAGRTGPLKSRTSLRFKELADNEKRTITDWDIESIVNVRDHSKLPNNFHPGSGAGLSCGDKVTSYCHRYDAHIPARGRADGCRIGTGACRCGLQKRLIRVVAKDSQPG